MLIEWSDKMNVKKRETITAYILVLPAVMMSVCVFLVPFLVCIVLSFFNVNLILSNSNQGFVGLQHYIHFFTNYDTLMILWYTLLFLLICLPCSIIGGFVLASLLRKKWSATGIIRTLNVMPWVVAGVCSAFMFRWVFNEANGGLINGILKMMEISKIHFLSDPNLNFVVIIMCIIWKSIPFAFIVLLSGMQAIPHEYYEAADIDGGNAFTKMRYITLPCLIGQFRILCVIITIGLLGGVDVMRTIGGSGDFKVIGYSMYLESFSSAGLSSGAAISVIMLIILIGLTLLYNKVLKMEKAV